MLRAPWKKPGLFLNHQAFCAPRREQAVFGAYAHFIRVLQSRPFSLRAD